MDRLAVQWVERLTSRMKNSDHGISQVGKVGLPHSLSEVKT